ncbi:MAG TPA: ACT domain-containing protein [Candidatus Ozemobacteraceae bacterium]|nr:ACT domain-containing protein [Candidatus Ozemobacteraceae bacterium]
MNKPRDRVVITAMGANRPGVLAGITRVLAEANVNIDDVSQKIMQEFFALIMVTDFSGANGSFEDIQGRLQKLADELKVKVFVQHESVFTFMHRL